MTAAKDKTKYGKVELDETYLDVKNHKVRVTTFIDGDVLKWLKNGADQLGIGYQTLLNMKLKEIMGGRSIKDDLKMAVQELLDEGKIIARAKDGTTIRSVPEKKQSGYHRKAR